MWDMAVKVIPVILDALGTTPKKLKQRLSDIGIETRIVDCRKLPSYILQGSPEIFVLGLRSLFNTEPQEI